MHEIFCVISIVMMSYFLLAKRKFDWFTIAFFSASIYFLPGYFGYTSYLSTDGWVESQISSEAYWIMIFVETMIFSAAFVSDLFMPEPVGVKEDQGKSRVPDILLILTLLGFSLMLLTTGKELLNTEKQEMMAGLNRAYILFSTATVAGIVLAYERKKKLLFAIFSLFIVFDLFIGFRISFAIAFISIVTISLSRHGCKRLLSNYWKQGVVCVLIGSFLFLYKQISFAVKSGSIELLGTLLFDTSEESIYSLMFLNSEPFITQTALNETILNKHYVGLDHLKGLLYQCILFAPQLGLETKTFNDLFQGVLFQEVEYGMASNIWAEMWSAGGWPLLLIFVLVYVIALKIFCILSATQNTTQRVLVAVMAAYWAFYIHRNDIIYQVGLEKRVLLVMGIAVCIAFFIERWRDISLKIVCVEVQREK